MINNKLAKSFSFRDLRYAFLKLGYILFILFLNAHELMAIVPWLKLKNYDLIISKHISTLNTRIC